jgi:hypothetical protein
MPGTVPQHRFYAWLSACAQYESKWRRENEAAYDYYDGEQWTDEEQAILDARGQQPTVLNVIRPTIDLVVAMQAERRIDYQIVGREESDELMARLLTELLKQVFDTCDYSYYETQAFRQGAIGGRGWLGVSDRDTEGNRQISVEHIPWEEMYVDPYHRKPDGSDARWMIRRVWMDRDEARTRWPDKEPDLDSCFTDDYHGLEYEAQLEAADRGLAQYDIRRDRIAVHETWYRDATGQVRYCVWSDQVFLEGSPDSDAANERPYTLNAFPYVCFYAFRRHRGQPRGLVKLIESAQDQINKLNSKYLWCLSSNRLMVEQGAVDNPDEAREEWSRPDGLVLLNNGGLQKTKTEDNLREASSMLQHLYFLLTMVQRTSGVNDSMIGVGGTNERSAQQQTQRILQGASMMTSLIENLWFAKRRVARLILRLIGETYTDRMVVRVVNPDGTASHYALNDPEGADGDGEPVFANRIEDILRFDVVLREVPPFSTTRENSMKIFSEVLKSGVLPPQIAGKVILMLSDLPGKEDIIYELEQTYAAMAGQQGPA